MGQATIADAFNAAAGFTQQTLGYMTEKEMEKNNLQLKNEAISFDINWQNKIRDTPYNGNFREYALELEQFIGQQYAQAKKRNSSPYYQQQISQMEKQSVAAAGHQALVKQDQWRVEQAEIRCENSIQAAMDSDLEPEHKMNAFTAAFDLLETEREVSPQERHAQTEAFRKALVTKTLTDDLGKVNNVLDLREELNKAKGKFDFDGWSTDVPILDDEGNPTGEYEKRAWGFNGQKEWEDALVERETKRIQNANFEIVQQKQAYMDRLVVSGRISEAIAYAKREGAEWNRVYNPNNENLYANYGNEHRDKGSHYFDWRTLETHQRNGTMPLMDAYNLEMFVRPQFNGDGTVIVGYYENGTPITERYDTLNEAIAGFIDYERQAFMHARGGEDAVTLQLWQAKEAEWFEKFYDEVGKALGQRDPQLKADFEKFRKFDTFINEKGEYYNKNSVKKLSDEDKDLYAQHCVDFFTSLFFNGVTDVPTIRQAMKDFTGQEITKVLQWKSTPSNDAKKIKQQAAFSDKAMSEEAEDIVFVKNQPERLALGLSATGEESGQTYVWRDKNQQEACEQVREEERQMTADALGLTVEDMQPRWMDSPRRKGDVIPKGIFTVIEGEKAGTYYMGYEENTRGEDANPVVMKWDSSAKEWKADPSAQNIERPLTASEQGKRNEKIMKEYSQKLLQGKNPITGGDCNYQEKPDPSLHMSDIDWITLPDDMKLLHWAETFRLQAEGK